VGARLACAGRVLYALGPTVTAPEARLIRWLREPASRDLLAERFRIEREAGIGGMGIVYRALDQTTGAVVALKVLRKTDVASTQRFANEVEALERLSDPAIVRYVAHGVLDDGQPYLAMEWVEGESLGERLENGALSIPEVLALGTRIASALRAAHELGIIHRDIKPGNVLLPGGAIAQAKVADFGLSRFLGTPHTTTVGLGLGTPGYAAPEQVRGTDDLDERADLFSLGCVLFRCLTNTEAFAGAEALTVIAKLVLEEPLRAKALRADVPPDLDDLVARLLAKDRAKRPASARVVLAALDAVRPGNYPSPQPSPEEGGSYRILSRRWGRIALGGGALALGLGWVALGARGGSHAAPSETAASHAAINEENATRITDLPASPACRQDAVLDYREGLQALREATTERAYSAFERAAAKDPACPEALLRVLQTARGLRPIGEQREHLRRLLVYRDALRERDRVLFEAAAALIAADPPDRQAASRIMSDGARRFPHDAELALLAGTYSVQVVKTAREMEGVLEVVRRATDLDPSFADAWLVLGWTYERLGRSDEEAKAYTRCLDSSPGAVECLQSRITLLRRAGRCDEAEALVRQWMARDPSSVYAYRLLAASIAAQGAPRESIEEVLRMRWAHLPQDPQNERDVVRLHDSAKLAGWTGNFTEALRLGEELERRTADEPHIEPHLRAARVLVDALLEMGRGAEAADFAERFLRRKIAWTDSALSGDQVESGAAYYEPLLLGVLVEQARLPPSGWVASGRAWEHAAQTRMNAFETWSLRWGSAVGAHVDAADAMENVPAPAAEDRILPTLISFQPGLLEAYEGRLRLASGDAARAAPLLETAARSCQGVDQPFLNTRAYLWLGSANEKLGNPREACDAYAVVERRWGKSVPRSLTAIEAAKRSRALGCSDGPR